MARAKIIQEDKLPDDKDDLKGGPGKYSFKLASFWKDQVKDVEKLEEPWHKRADEIIVRYRDDRKKVDTDLKRKLNIFWANVKVLHPALYGQAPKPVIERRFLQKDPVGRTSSKILERNTSYQIEINGFHSAMKKVVLDYLLPGRGIVWVRYEPEIESGGSLPVLTESSVSDELSKIAKEVGKESGEDNEGSEKLETTGEQITAEQAPVDYINFKDFKMIPRDARTWDEVQAVAKRVYISKKEAKERFGEKVAKDLQPDIQDKQKPTGRTGEVGSNAFHDINERSISVYEIWNKTDRRIYWINLGYRFLCDVKDDFLKLKKFFPTPEPLSSTLTNDSLIPVPDYWEYQDQAIQIDELTQRLALLTKACKVAGTYDSSNGPLKRLLQEGFENDLLPVDSWAVFAEKGGVKGGISFLPIDEIQKVIETLQTVKQSLMQDLDLISGITDVQRGTTDSRETLGGIRLKNNTTGSRLSERQNEVARFARDTVAIVAEIAAKHFSDKTLIQASGILFDDDMQPEAILSELEAKKPPQQAQQQAPQMPGAMPQMPMQQAPGGPPMPPTGGMPPMPPQMSQNNVVPFPGQPGMGHNSIPGMAQNPLEMIGAMPPPIDPNMIIEQRLEKAIDLLRSEVPFGYRIDIETDSTIYGDSQQERQDATEFVTAGVQLLNGMAPLATEMPEAVPMFGRFLQWATRKYRVGRDLESSIDSFVEAMEKKSKEAVKNPQPNPEQQKAQAELQKIQMETDARKKEIMLEQQAAQQQMQVDQITQQTELQHKTKLAEMEANTKIQMAEIDMQVKKQQANLQMQTSQQKMQMDQASAHQKLQVEQASAQQQMQLEGQKSQQQLSIADKEHGMKLEQMDRQGQLDKSTHESKMKEMKMQSSEKAKTRKDQAAKKKASK